MMLKLIMVLAAAVGLLVLLVEGLDPFAIWNLLPVLLVVTSAATAQLSHDAGRSIRGLIAVPSLAMLGVVAFAHLAWHFDWARTATGSSTSSLLFIFIPIYALIVGGATVVIVAVGRMVIRKKAHGA